jgi:hypothetical protein
VPDQPRVETSNGQTGVESAAAAVSVDQRDPLADQQPTQAPPGQAHAGQRPRPHARQRHHAHRHVELAQPIGHAPLGRHRAEDAQAAPVERGRESEQALLAAPDQPGEVGEEQHRWRLRRLVAGDGTPTQPAGQLGQAHAVDEDDERGHRAQHEAVPPLAEALLRDELASERGHWLGDQRPERGEWTQPRAAAAQHLGVVGRVQEQLAYVVGERVVATVQQIGGEIADGAVDHDLLVHQGIVEAAAIAPEEPQHGARVPAAVTDEAAQVGRQPRHTKADGGAGRGDRRLDRSTQRRRHLLVSVEAQHPRAGGLGHREVLLLSEPGDHVALDDARAVLAADGARLVATVLVDDDDLLGPADAVQAGADARRLVARDEDHGDRGPFSHEPHRHASGAARPAPRAGGPPRRRRPRSS